MAKAQAHEIEIEISPDGKNIDYHVQGIKGKSCVEATKFLDEIGTVTDRKFTREANETEDKKVVNVGFNRGR